MGLDWFVMVTWVLHKVVSITESVIRTSPTKMAPLEAVRKRIQSGRVWVAVWATVTFFAQGLLCINQQHYASTDPNRPDFADSSSIKEMADLMFARNTQLFSLAQFTASDMAWMYIRYANCISTSSLIVSFHRLLVFLLLVIII